MDPELSDNPLPSPGAPITISSSLFCWSEVDGSGKVCAGFLRESFRRAFFVLVGKVEEVAMIVDACVTTMVLRSSSVCRFLKARGSAKLSIGHKWSHYIIGSRDCLTFF